MGIENTAHGGAVFFRRQQSFQFLKFIRPAGIALVKRLRDTAPAYIARENDLFLRGGIASFGFDLLQGADGFHIVAILCFLPTMAQLVIRNTEVFRHRQDCLGRFFSRIRQRLRCLRRKQFLIPLIQSQQMFKHRQAFRSEDGIRQRLIKQLHMALVDLRDVKGSVIQIDSIAYAICRP